MTIKVSLLPDDTSLNENGVTRFEVRKSDELNFE